METIAKKYLSQLNEALLILYAKRIMIERLFLNNNNKKTVQFQNRTMMQSICVTINHLLRPYRQLDLEIVLSWVEQTGSMDSFYRALNARTFYEITSSLDFKRI